MLTLERPTLTLKLGTSDPTLDEKHCRLQHRAQEAIRAAGVGGVFELQRRKL